MTLKSLTLTNFRGIRDLRLDFSAKVNLLAGVNGAGKTAILDCAAIMLSRLVGRMRSTTGTGRFFSEHDITNGMSETRCAVETLFRFMFTADGGIYPRTCSDVAAVETIERLAPDLPKLNALREAALDGLCDLRKPDIERVLVRGQDNSFPEYFTAIRDVLL